MRPPDFLLGHKYGRGLFALELVVQAVEMTFDGKHPCSLCLKIRRGRQEQERQDQKFPSPGRDVSLNLFYQEESVTVPPRPSEGVNLMPIEPERGWGMVYCPPKPPPRS
ncbi:MAG: hypothetical protein U1G07_01895 [Verrucomicrobiota bacterium]